MKVTAVAEPQEEKREAARMRYGLPENRCFSSAEEMLAQPKLADVMVIATQDRQHVEQAVNAIKKGYHVLCEKPISPDPEECRRLQKAAHEYKRIVAVGHVLRYTPFYSKIKELIARRSCWGGCFNSGDGAGYLLASGSQLCERELEKDRRDESDDSCKELS